VDLAGKSAGALLAGGISIAALHAVIPSHWLAFALVGKAQQWPIRRTIWATALAGSGHVIMTTAAGCLVAAIGKDISERLPAALEHGVTAGLLILLGLYFMFSASRRDHRSCGLDVEGLHVSPDTVAVIPRRANDSPSRVSVGAERGTLAAMAVGMTLSPCLDLLPIYLAASALSWTLIIGISVAMAAVTLSIMLALVWVTSLGLARLNLHWLEHYEGYAVGAILILLGVGLVLV
jgi:nickel/cobalt transporter (NicO) family protein